MVRLIVLALVGAVLGIILLNVLRNLFGEGPVAIIWIAILITVIVVVVRNLATNRKVPDAAPELRTQALAFTPDPAKAALYILRTQFVGKAVGVNVMIDGREVAQIKSPRFTRILLTPGAHRVSGYVGTNKKPGDSEGLALDAKPGEMLVIMCEVEPQMVGSVIKFKPLVLDHVRATLTKTRMVQPDVAEV
jgi:hypothetical protein